MPWTADDMPSQRGKTIVVTGANSGLGYETSLELARRGAHVVMACRDQAKGRQAVEAIRAQHAAASLALLELDLASLQSIRSAAATLRAQHQTLDVLCNNAGVMAIPQRRTADGFEMQFGTNHLGHFALTGLLLDRLLATPGARVVNVSSNAHKFGSMKWDDLMWEHGYRKWFVYSQSKLANLLFTFELQRRLAAAGARAISVASHPGYSATNLQAVGPQMQGSSFAESLMGIGNRLFAQSAAVGALPSLYAATAPDVGGGDFFGPDGFAEQWGHPRKVTAVARAHDVESQRRLWEASERLTGVHYDGLDG